MQHAGRYQDKTGVCRPHAHRDGARAIVGRIRAVFPVRQVRKVPLGQAALLKLVAGNEMVLVQQALVANAQEKLPSHLHAPPMWIRMTTCRGYRQHRRRYNKHACRMF